MKQYVKTIQQIMDLCVQHTKNTMKLGYGGPFGAAIAKYHYDLDLFEVVCVESNSVLKDNDPTAHAEVNAIRKACFMLDTFDLTGYILVTTGESCPMCRSAIAWANIKTVYYGTTYDDATKLGFRDDHILKHLKGEVKIFDEIPTCRHIAIELHNIWDKKNDRTDY